MPNDTIIEKNILAIKHHSEETRKRIKEVEEENRNQKLEITDLKQKLEMLSKQVTTLFQRM